MAVPNPTIAVYGGDAELVQAIKNSGFNTLVLWSLHVEKNGDLVYNSTDAVSDGVVNTTNLSSLQQALTELRGAGVETVLGSIGAGGPPAPEAFPHIQTLLSTSAGTQILQANFQALADYLSLDGFDFDDELKATQVSTDTIGRLTKLLHGYGQKKIITYCPYGTPTETFWLDCMHHVYIDNGEQLVSWWNLQIYGDNADPRLWIKAMNQYMHHKPIGVPNANAFIIPGLLGTEKASDIQTYLATWQNPPNTLALQGGFIWNISNIQTNATQVAQAITDGLRGIPPVS